MPTICAIGDIHGKLGMLDALLGALLNQYLSSEDAILFLGDYVDRGENSAGVISRLIRLREERANTIFLRGNHEQEMLDALEGPPSQPAESEDTVVHSVSTIRWLRQGGAETLISYGTADAAGWQTAIPRQHVAFLEATAMEYVTPRYLFVHAGLLPPGRAWTYADEGLDPRLWIREQFLNYHRLFDGRVVVFGHTPLVSAEPLVERNKLGLDTGAVYGGALTAALIDIDAPYDVRHPPRFVQVRAG